MPNRHGKPPLGATTGTRRAIQQTAGIPNSSPARRPQVKLIAVSSPAPSPALKVGENHNNISNHSVSPSSRSVPIYLEDPEAYRPSTPILNWQGPPRSFRPPKLQLWLFITTLTVVEMVVAAVVPPYLESGSATFIALWVAFCALLTAALTFMSTTRHLHHLSMLMESINTPLDMDMVVEKLQKGRFSRFEETWRVQVHIIKMFCRLLKFHHGVNPVSGRLLSGAGYDMARFNNMRDEMNDAMGDDDDDEGCVDDDNTASPRDGEAELDDDDKYYLYSDVQGDSDHDERTGDHDPFTLTQQQQGYNEDGEGKRAAAAAEAAVDGYTFPPLHIDEPTNDTAFEGLSKEKEQLDSTELLVAVHSFDTDFDMHSLRTAGSSPEEAALIVGVTPSHARGSRGVDLIPARSTSPHSDDGGPPIHGVRPSSDTAVSTPTTTAGSSSAAAAAAAGAASLHRVAPAHGGAVGSGSFNDTSAPNSTVVSPLAQSYGSSSRIKRPGFEPQQQQVRHYSSAERYVSPFPQRRHSRRRQSIRNNGDPLGDSDKTWDEVLGEEADDEKNKGIMLKLLRQISIGDDLSKVVFPVHILEPRSLLEKLSDLFVHGNLLGTIADQTDAISRTIAIARWFVSGFHVRPKGAKKPYNPILGETFECVFGHRTSHEVHYFAEQVSHHPPGSVFRAMHRASGVSVVASFFPRSSFVNPNCGASIGQGVITVDIPGVDTYTLSWPSVYVNGVTFGIVRVEVVGEVKIECASNKSRAIVNFTRKGWFGGEYDAVKGHVYGGTSKQPTHVIEGKWPSTVTITRTQQGGLGGDPEVLFSTSAEEAQRPRAPPTTFPKPSRHVWQNCTIALRAGDAVGAKLAKEELENAERELRRAREARGEEFIPGFFRRTSAKKQPHKDTWRYIGPRYQSPRGSVLATTATTTTAAAAAQSRGSALISPVRRSLTARRISTHQHQHGPHITTLAATSSIGGEREIHAPHNTRHHPQTPASPSTLTSQAITPQRTGSQQNSSVGTPASRTGGTFITVKNSQT